MKIKALKAAFPHTIPVLFGYLFLGIGFGILLSSKGFAPAWSVWMSAVIFAGSMQYAAISLLTAPTSLLTAAMLTLTVNARHLFYGLSLIEKFRDMKGKKPYMIFALTDETYSLLCSTKAPDDVDQNWFYFFIALLDHIYWILGTLIGAVAGSILSFDWTGIDFAMTALFVVIFIEQWESASNHTPALIGVLATVVSLIFVGSQNFIMAAMLLIFLLLTMFRSKLEGGKTK